MAARGSMDENDKRRLVLRLVTQLRCVDCGRPFDPHDFALIQRRKDMWVLGTRCHYCDVPCQVVVFMHLDPAPEPVTDLTPEELRAAEEWPPITADDVLDVHEALCRCDDLPFPND